MIKCSNKLNNNNNNKSKMKSYSNNLKKEVVVDISVCFLILKVKFKTFSINSLHKIPNNNKIQVLMKIIILLTLKINFFYYFRILIKNY